MGIESFKLSLKMATSRVLLLKTYETNRCFLFQDTPIRPSIGRPVETDGIRSSLTSISIRPSKVCHATATTSRANVDVIVPDCFQKFCSRKSNIALFKFLISLQPENDF